ncbi:protein-glutamate O-methyltransferase CheR [Archangium sp.]|uniref:CheR family methyltransferase n=1 Tax=Archangium sp. TaxID=1872627 RepID=UPI002D55E632|nr:protein-glutamate O-methyltransferase CheR [Archangium sp.]HYO53586.1 protein-glutamate O-methyltransferase CheR [Archangium sp.]
MHALALPPPVFRILSGLIEEHSGLSFRPEDAELLAEKATPRALELGFDSMLEYYYYLRYDQRGALEMDVLTESLLVHETYFFREVKQLQALVDFILAPEAPSRIQRVWCAAAATGEEPYTLAILLAERGLLDRVSILATDIGTQALERARRAEYGERSLRALPAGVLGKWLHRRGEKVSVEPSLREHVEWARVNLKDEEALRRLGTFDAILCRNVLIYFSDEVTRRVVEFLTACLHPGGYLLVGASESLMRFGTSLASIELGGAFFYRRMAG